MGKGKSFSVLWNKWYISSNHYCLKKMYMVIWQTKEILHTPKRNVYKCLHIKFFYDLRNVFAKIILLRNYMYV